MDTINKYNLFLIYSDLKLPAFVVWNLSRVGRGSSEDTLRQEDAEEWKPPLLSPQHIP